MIYIQSAFSQDEQRLELVGRQGEGGTRQLVFDCADILAEYPAALIVCAMQRAGDRKAYLKDCAADGANRVVTLESADVAVPGILKIELRALIGDDVRKSAVYIAKVAESLRGEQDRPGNPIADVLNRIDMTISRAEESIAEADAAAQSAREVADTVQTKLDNGDFVGPAGEDGKDGEKGPKGDTGATGPQGAPGSDASVTAENVQAALGYMPVKDVQMDGESLVQDSVATIPIAGYNRLGAVKLDPAGFAAASVEGMLSLVPPTDAQISTHTHTQRPITPSCMDYAVKAAMCDGKGAAWTAAEQKAARERMGVGKAYELIEEIVLNESVAQVARTNISLAEMRIVIEVPVSDSTGAIALEVYSGSSMIGYGYIGNFINKGNIKIAKFTVKRDRGTYAFSYVIVNANSAVQRAGAGTLSESASLFPVENAITKISLYSTSDAIPLPIGTKIKIEGETI